MTYTGTRGKACRTHSPIDSSCLLDSEAIPSSAFSWNLLSYMETRDIGWLRSHYPELVFTIRDTKPSRAEADYWVKRRGRWLTARWRHTKAD